MPYKNMENIFGQYLPFGPINALQKYGKLIWAIFALQMERNKTKTNTNCPDPNLESWQ